MKMFQLNDVLVYGNNGVFRLEDIRNESIMGKTMTYYILEPIFENRSRFYVPVSNETLTATLRPVMMKETLHEMMISARDSDVAWQEDDRIRDREFHDIVAGGMSCDLLRVMKAIILHKIELKNTVKKLHSADEKILAACKRIIGEEFAFAFGVEVDDALSHIESEFIAA